MTDPLICPACNKEKVTAYFQGTVEVPPGGAPRVVDTIDSDSFVSAGCANLECGVELVQEHGDGRLRNAHLENALAPNNQIVVIDDPALLAAFIEAVESILKRLGSS